MNDQIFNVLFLGSGNSARSIMAEAILNHIGKGRFHAFSAGSHPDDLINPLAIEQIQRANLPIEALNCKSWNEFAKSNAPTLDFVFTVCDEVAQEEYPKWRGQPMVAHWGVEDPDSVEGSIEEKHHAFSKAFTQINWRISIFTSLPLAKLSSMALKSELDNISQLKERRNSPRHVSPLAP
jgi:arsenate reductase